MIYTYVVAHFWPWFFIGGCVFLAAIIGFTVWYIISEPVDDWDDDWQRLPVAQEIMQEIFPEPVQIGHDEWEALDPDQAADQLIAEWHDAPAERTVTRDVWDEWWNGLDGLDRECLTVTRWREREERLWAELKAETDDLCPLAVAA